MNDEKRKFYFLTVDGHPHHISVTEHEAQIASDDGKENGFTATKSRAVTRNELEAIVALFFSWMKVDELWSNGRPP